MVYLSHSFISAHSCRPSVWSCSLRGAVLEILRMRTSESVKQQQPVNMAGVGFRRWAQALSKAKGSGISALLSGCRAG